MSSKAKKPYVKPKTKTEELVAFGALCNGTTNLGRKETTGAPQFCQASKIKS